jgi:hypothetical protein
MMQKSLKSLEHSFKRSNLNLKFSIHVNDASDTKKTNKLDRRFCKEVYLRCIPILIATLNRTLKFHKHYSASLFVHVRDVIFNLIGTHTKI